MYLYIIAWLVLRRTGKQREGVSEDDFLHELPSSAVPDACSVAPLAWQLGECT